MSNKNYWIEVFTGATWKEFLESGAEISGFRKHRWKTVQQIKQGDYLLCYLTGASRFIGVLEVVSEGFKDENPIWGDDDLPCRVKVKGIVTLTPETAIPVHELKDELSVFKNLKNPNHWSGAFRRSPTKWEKSDGEVVVNALMNAKLDPVIRPVDESKLSNRPVPLTAKIGSVTVPEREDEVHNTEPSKEPTPHEEIQWMLLKLGSEMGLDVWVARNDRGREVNGNQFTKISRIRSELPRQFDDATNRTIELIDVLWLKGNAIVAAFEVESTTSIYSGLLRMSDLISMQPNLNIPLYLVAPDERRDKVITEVNRPTFSRLSPPMSQICQYISFSSLKDGMSRVSSVIRYLKPDFLEELSESCEVE